MTQDTITRAGYRFVALWAIGIVCLYAITGYLGVWTLQSYKAETIQMRQTWLRNMTTESAKSAPDSNQLGKSKPVEVRTGIYVNRIGEFAVKEPAGQPSSTFGSVGTVRR